MEASRGVFCPSIALKAKNWVFVRKITKKFQNFPQISLKQRETSQNSPFVGFLAASRATAYRLKGKLNQKFSAGPHATNLNSRLAQMQCNELLFCSIFFFFVAPFYDMCVLND